MINYNEHKEVLLIAARSHFWAYCCYYDFDFFYNKRPFLKQVAVAFQDIVDNYRNGKAISVSVSMPPRSGKSYITSLFASYWLGCFPELSVMRNSCTATLYGKFSYDTRNILKSKKFTEVFSSVKLQQDKQNIDGWNVVTSKQVGYFGSGVGGTIIGFGANLAITDDLYKSMADALSATTNNAVKLWKESAHDSRKEKNCPEIYIGTRWIKDDIIGNAVDSGLCKHIISIPALIDGCSFCEDVKSTDEYLHIKETVSETTWAAEYMQEPLNVKGMLLPYNSLIFADLHLIPDDKIHYRFAVGDPADKGGDKYSIAFIDVIEYEDKLMCYVRDVIHNTTGIEANTERITERLKYNSTEHVYIESNGVGLASVLLLKNRLTPSQKLIPFTSSTQKEVRIFSHYEFVQRHFIFRQTTEKEYVKFISDVTSYTTEGDNKHRMDAIDVLCSAANVVKIKYKKILYG